MLNTETIKRFHEDGAVLLPGALSARQLAVVEAAYAHRLEHLSDNVLDLYKGSGATFITDTTNLAAWPAPQFQSLLHETPLADIAGEVFSTRDVWFFYEQIFLKQGGSARRTPWHQDSSYIPGRGPDFCRMWINLDPVRKADSLEFIRGSHLGPTYNGSIFDPDDDTAPLYAEDALPRLPDVEKDRGAWDILSWDITPGDIVLFHPATLHGGAGTVPGVRRRTLSMVYFGADAWYEPRPAVQTGGGELAGDKLDAVNGADPFMGQKDGDPFRPSYAVKLRSEREGALASA